ncbi:imelysin family protein [Rhodoferax sp. TH121]|uniref:imelysin family protein n=1 Tax=Rhodoferax sp. TH121 TaxID=2022803 RepID=UPI001595C5C1|nr:imelysin family protein [Rhodoferax sp. TH121]
MDIAQAATKTIATPKVAAPYISSAQMVQGLLAQHLLPSAAALQLAAQALVQSLAQAQAPWAQHRPLWVNAMLAWERLAAVAVGPLLERRSARAIDFWPTRPAQIQRLLESGSVTAVAQLDTVGATARGLPALEWLLWKTDGSGHAQAYASVLAQQVLAESQALQTGYQTLASTEREEEDAWALYGEWFGQAVGGLDQLRIKKMVADTRGKDSAPWVRGLSGQTAACWQAQAQGLQAFLLGSPAAQAATQAATPGWPVAGSLNSLLLGRGHLRDSLALQERTATLLRAVQAARPGNVASVRAAQAALAQVSALANGLASDVLTITMGFTDADGD